MIFTKNELKNFTNELVIAYSNIDNEGNRFININDIPEFYQDKLCSLIINETKEYGNEILGSDNDDFNPKVLPSLISYLKDSNKKETKEDFLTTLRYGIRNYLYHNMVFLLEKEIKNLNYQIEAA